MAVEALELTFPAEAELTLPRAKPGRRMISFAYGLKWVGQRLLGGRRLLRLCLDGSWILRRFAHELGGEVFGSRFYAATMGLSEELLRAWIPAGGSVLDVGCGTGRWCRVAARSASRVLGIDYSQASIKQARALGAPPNVEYRLGDVTQAVAEERFDAALLVHVLEHIEDAEALLETLGALASTLIVEVPDFEGDGLNLIRRQLGCRWYTDEDHVREYTLPLLREQLQRAGWSVRSAERRHGMLVVAAVRDGEGSAE